MKTMCNPFALDSIRSERRILNKNSNHILRSREFCFFCPLLVKLILIITSSKNWLNLKEKSKTYKIICQTFLSSSFDLVWTLCPNILFSMLLAASSTLIKEGFFLQLSSIQVCEIFWHCYSVQFWQILKFVWSLCLASCLMISWVFEFSLKYLLIKPFLAMLNPSNEWVCVLSIFIKLNVWNSPWKVNKVITGLKFARSEARKFLMIEIRWIWIHLAILTNTAVFFCVPGLGKAHYFYMRIFIHTLYMQSVRDFINMVHLQRWDSANPVYQHDTSLIQGGSEFGRWIDDVLYLILSPLYKKSAARDKGALRNNDICYWALLCTGS